MRAVIASRIFAPEAAAAAFRLTAVANALAQAGHEVTVLTGRVTDPEAPDVDIAVDVRRAPVLRDTSGTVRGYLPYLSFDVPLFFRLLFSRRSDIVLAEPPPTTGLVVRIACALRRVPYVYYAADVWTEALRSTGVPGVLRTLVSAVERGVLTHATRVIAVSDAVGQAVSSISPHASVTVVPNGIDTSVFSPDGDRTDLGTDAVYAGTTSEWQGADVFIRALPRVRDEIPDARIVFIGQGSAWSGLRDLADEVGLADVVHFVDVAPPSVAASWLRGARAGLVSLRPGAGYDFAVPTKIYASLAVGTPVVFSGPDGPAADLIRGSDLGVAVDDDVERVARALADGLRSAPSAERRAELSSWVDGRASLAETGRLVAALLSEACAGN